MENLKYSGSYYVFCFINILHNMSRLFRCFILCPLCFALFNAKSLVLFWKILFSFIYCKENVPKFGKSQYYVPSVFTTVND